MAQKPTLQLPQCCLPCESGTDSLLDQLGGLLFMLEQKQCLKARVVVPIVLAMKLSRRKLIHTQALSLLVAPLFQ